ncbi:hypothetical protein SDC9_78985 [bioreactor metagenome]|uniref:Uncharacterized protein n=1 Tax=bioreactor metagenome TaxID=1076179 RepID=A0A644Z125_9ZZZZ
MNGDRFFVTLCQLKEDVVCGVGDRDVTVAGVQLDADTVFPLQVRFNQLGSGLRPIALQVYAVDSDAVAKPVRINMPVKLESSVSHDNRLLNA